MKPAFVEKNGRFLRLAGPFEYPEWKTDASMATIMGSAKASGWANAYGARLVFVDANGSASFPESPETKREGAASDPDSYPGFTPFGG